MITSFFGLMGLIQKVSDHPFFINMSSQVRPVTVVELQAQMESGASLCLAAQL